MAAPIEGEGAPLLGEQGDEVVVPGFARAPAGQAEERGLTAPAVVVADRQAVDLRHGHIDLLSSTSCERRTPTVSGGARRAGARGVSRTPRRASAVPRRPEGRRRSPP